MPSDATPPAAPAPARPAKPDPKILFQDFFKSVGPRTYAAQVKEAGNGNHFLVLTEGKRDEGGELRKTRLFVFSEDFPAFFRMLKASAEFIKAHPVSDDVKKKRDKYWAKQAGQPGGATGVRTDGSASAAANRSPRLRRRPTPRRKFTALMTTGSAGA